MYGNYLYGAVAYSETPITEDDITLLVPDLMRYMPRYYSRKTGLIKSIEDASALEIARILYRLEDLKKQYFIDTATWGLAWYERDLGIATDISKPYIYRREIIKARLRGRGTITKQLIINTAKAFSGGDVDVIEYPSEFRFVVKFVGILGIPPNMAGLKEEIENIKPAHLLYDFEYTYTTWDMLKQLTWDDARNYTWNEIKSYKGGA